MEPVVPGLGEDSQDTVQDLISLLIQGGGANRHQILQQLVEMGHGENASTALTMTLPRSYMADIDTRSLLQINFVRPSITPLLDDECKGELMQQIGFSFNGRRTAERSLSPTDLSDWGERDLEMTNDIEIYSSSVILELLAVFKQFWEIISFLGLAPCLGWQVVDNGHFGLGRRFLSIRSDIKGEKRHEPSKKVECYHIWFVLPVSELLQDNADEKLGPGVKNVFDGLHMHYTQFPIIQLTFQDIKRCFYMQFNLQSRSTRIFNNIGDKAVEKFCEVCQQGVQEEEYDPFIFLCSSISELLHRWVVQGLFYTKKIRDIEAKVLALGQAFERSERPESKEAREIERGNLENARKLILELHEFRSYQLRQKRNVECLSNVANESVKEHCDMRETLCISSTAYLKVHKNLCTLASWLESTKENLESAQKVTDSCLSTLSFLLNMRNNRSVEENTKFLATMAEHSNEENHQVKDIAEASQRDSEAMKTIAIMTMFYLPASFVATLFSMGIFNFDFENGRKGTISLSTSWWIYAVVTIPLTISTFLFFWYMHGRKNIETKETEAKRLG
ncbi:hypothetical protein ATEIFO6365_0008019600 [Aspergillus terreus]|uniref:Uncharacterized protein n=1 Tax=Aspergillus terreus TaxID=33178 RepID=A0A5M3Z779_ASPTE|nr:hypothetical protein ATETN484_0010020500 [Aspergillus terreus]GFF18252.1 hypothetical protein ATEIFO6365_0008019600 [Aspergillus terreus]